MKALIIVLAMALLFMTTSYAQTPCDPVYLGLNRVELKNGDTYCGEVTLFNGLLMIDLNPGAKRSFPITSLAMMVEVEYCHNHHRQSQ